MPRRTRPLKPYAEAVIDATEAARLRADIEEIAYRDEALRRLPDARWDSLIAALVDAVMFARIGLAHMLAGKRSKPAAWTTDILVRDVCDALSAAGIKLTMAARRDASLAQRLAGELAGLAGLPDQGELFKQMQRARRIKVSGGATCPGRPMRVLGRWQVRSN